MSFGVQFGDGPIRELITRVGIPLIHRHMVRRHQLKVCGHISQEFVTAVAREGIPGATQDNGRHTVAIVTLRDGGRWSVDLSYAQFLCDIDDDDELAAMIAKVAADPWVSIRYSRF